MSCDGESQKHIGRVLLATGKPTAIKNVTSRLSLRARICTSDFVRNDEKKKALIMNVSHRDI